MPNHPMPPPYPICEAHAARLAALPQRRTSPNHVFPGRKPDLNHELDRQWDRIWRLEETVRLRHDAICEESRDVHERLAAAERVVSQLAEDLSSQSDLWEQRYQQQQETNRGLYLQTLGHDHRLGELEMSDRTHRQRMDVTDEILDLRHTAISERLKGSEMLAAMVEEQSRVAQERDETHRQRMADLWARQDAMCEEIQAHVARIQELQEALEGVQKRLKELDVDGNGERG